MRDSGVACRTMKEAVKMMPFGKRRGQMTDNEYARKPEPESCHPDTSNAFDH